MRAAAAQQPDGSNATGITLPTLVALRGSVPSVRRRAGRRVSAPSTGGVMSRALGRGLDFAEVREYYPGDDVRLIDWNVTARSGRPHTKVFNEEKERPFVVVVDLRSAMFFATRVAFKSVVAARLAAMLAWAAADNRDRVGGLIFNDSELVELKPASGVRGVSALLQTLVRKHGGPVSAGNASLHPADVMQRLDQRVHSGSSVCLISDFAGFDLARAGAGHRLLTHNHIVALQIYDPLEASLPPPSRYAVSDGRQRSLFDSSEPSTRDAYAAAFSARSRALNQAFSGPGNCFIACSVEANLPEVARRVIRHLPGSQ